MAVRFALKRKEISKVYSLRLQNLPLMSGTEKLSTFADEVRREIQNVYKDRSIGVHPNLNLDNQASMCVVYRFKEGDEFISLLGLALSSSHSNSKINLVMYTDEPDIVRVVDGVLAITPKSVLGQRIGLVDFLNPNKTFPEWEERIDIQQALLMQASPYAVS